jgi:hypothetical protein
LYSRKRLGYVVEKLYFFDMWLGLSILPEPFTGLRPLVDLLPLGPVGLLLLAFAWQAVVSFV